MNANRRPVAPVRKLVAAILGTIAVFVMLFGLGMGSWAVVALGAAMLALAIGLTLVNVVRRGARTWVAGTAHVTAASEPPASSAYGRCELQIVVAAPGLPTSAVKVRDSRVPIDRWPVAGDTLPVSVDVDDMRRVRIQWDQVPTHTEAAMGAPTAYADSLDDIALEDDLLAEPEAPPWVTRERQWADDTDATADLTGQFDDPHADGPRTPDTRTPDPRTSDTRTSDTRTPGPRAGGTRASGAWASGVRPAGPSATGVRADDLRPGELREQPVVVRDAPGGGPVVLEGTLVDTDLAPNPLPRRARPSPRPRPRPDSRPRPDGASATTTVEPDQSLDDLLNAGTDDTGPDDPTAHDPTPHDLSAAAPSADRAAPEDGPGAASAWSAPGAGPTGPIPPTTAQTPSGPAAGAWPAMWPMDHPERDVTPPPVAVPTPGAASTRAAGPAAAGPAATEPAATGRAAADPVTSDPEIDLPLDEGPDEVAKLVVLAPGDRHDDTADTADQSPPGISTAEAPARSGDRMPGGAAPIWPGTDPHADEHVEDLITAYPSARPGPGGAIHGVGITVLVTDLQRAVRFYRDMLGFFEIDGGHGSAVLASGDTRLVLRTVHDLSSMTGRLIYLNLEVGDLDAVHAELRDKGVKFVHGPRPVNRGDRLELWAASFHDPDGHNIAVTQWRALP